MDEAGAHLVLAELSDAGQTVVPTVHRKVRRLRVEHGGILGSGATASFVPVEAG